MANSSDAIALVKTKALLFEGWLITQPDVTSMYVSSEVFGNTM